MIASSIARELMLITSGMFSGDEIHFFHVVPNPQAKLLGGGLGLADAGEFMVQAPDPKDDRKQASNSVLTMISCHS